MSKWKSKLNRVRQQVTAAVKPDATLPAGDVPTTKGIPQGHNLLLQRDFPSGNVCDVKPVSIFGHAKAASDWWKGAKV